jgi:hypothetical protein
VANFYGDLLLFKFLVVCSERNDLKSGTIGKLERLESRLRIGKPERPESRKGQKTGTTGMITAPIF